MGNDHSQEINQCLSAWRTISKRAVAALTHCNMEDLEQCIEQAHRIQERLETYLAVVDRNELSPEIRALMAEIREIQAPLLSEMQKGVSVLGEQIDAVRKNAVLLQGYKQPIPATAPRYLNKRT